MTTYTGRNDLPQEDRPLYEDACWFRCQEPWLALRNDGISLELGPICRMRTWDPGAIAERHGADKSKVEALVKAIGRSAASEENCVGPWAALWEAGHRINIDALLGDLVNNESSASDVSALYGVPPEGAGELLRGMKSVTTRMADVPVYAGEASLKYDFEV